MIALCFLLLAILISLVFIYARLDRIIRFLDAIGEMIGEHLDQEAK